MRTWASIAALGARFRLRHRVLASVADVGGVGLKPGSPACSGISMGDAYLLPMWCPVFRRRDSHLGFRTELETLRGPVRQTASSG